MQVQSYISDIFENYFSIINNIDPNTWNGASKEHLVKIGTDSIKKYDSTIYGQLSSLNSAIACYDEWLSTKQLYEKYKYYASTCSGETEESLRRKNAYIKKANQCAAQMTNLARTINTMLSGIKSQRLYSQDDQAIDQNINTSTSENNHQNQTETGNQTQIENDIQDQNEASNQPPAESDIQDENEVTNQDQIGDSTQNQNQNIDQKEFVEYYKEDYANDSYGNGTTIASAGSGPTAMAMVVATLTDKEITPVDAANWSLEHGYRCYGNGTYWTYFDAYAQENGLSCTQSNINGNSIMSSLQSGDPVIVAVGPGEYTDNGHFVVLTGLTDDGKVSIIDPNSRTKSSSTYDLDLFLREGTQQWTIK